MNNFLTQSNWGTAILAGCIAFSAAAIGLFAYRRNRKPIEPPRASTEAPTGNAGRVQPSKPAVLLPEYPSSLEMRNRAMLAARSNAQNQRRPGVAARWKSQNRVGAGI